MVPGSEGQEDNNPEKSLGETSAQTAAPLVQHEVKTDKLSEQKVTDDIASDRIRACEKARKILASAAAPGRKIEDYEVLQCLQLWWFKKNSNRSNVRPDGADYALSDTLGVTQLPSTKETILSPCSRRCPEFTRLITQWFDQHLPAEARGKFVYSSINSNKNYAGKLHRNLANEGPSFIKAFGKFTGGELVYYPADAGRGPLVKASKEGKVAVAVNDHLMLFSGKPRASS